MDGGDHGERAGAGQRAGAMTHNRCAACYLTPNPCKACLAQPPASGDDVSPTDSMQALQQEAMQVMEMLTRGATLRLELMTATTPEARADVVRRLAALTAEAKARVARYQRHAEQVGEDR